MTTTAEQAGAPPIQSGRAGVGATANGPPMKTGGAVFLPDEVFRRFAGSVQKIFRFQSLQPS